jgi:hypothetical protein
MNLKCPHCRTVNEYERREIGVYVTCGNCRRQFRPGASVPIISSSRSFTGVAENDLGAIPTAKSFASPEEWTSLTRRGVEFFNRQLYDEAERELRKSLRINPNQPTVPRMLRSIQGMRRHSQLISAS